MTLATAEIIADSISPDGVRITTIVWRGWRPMLAEFNTHRAFGRSSASSRARSMTKTLAEVDDNPFYPEVWASEQKGMSGGAELTGDDLDDAEDLWLDVRHSVIEEVRKYIESHPEPEHRLHKSLLNRLLEVWMGHTVIVTATAWENFFAQRCHEAAQPEMRDIAEAIQRQLWASTPVPIGASDWHLPFVRQEDLDEIGKMHEAIGADDAAEYHDMVREDACKVSAARCANVSYKDPVTGEELSVEASLRIYDRLVEHTPPDPVHYVPLEHVATPWKANRQVHCPTLWVPTGDGNQITVPTSHLPRVGNLLGWRSLRTTVEVQRGAVTFK